jgi:hypothetical protein
MTAAPAVEYAQRLKSCEAAIAALERRHARIASVRLLLAGVAIALAVAALWHALSGLWLIAPAVGFVAAVVRHARVNGARSRAQRAAAFYRLGLARIEDRWSGSGPTGERFADPHHVYASDLDLFGAGSLFQLLSGARTRMGEATLAQWLLAPANVVEIARRHECIADLAPRLQLREDFAVAGEVADVGVQPVALANWAETPNTLTQRWLMPLSVLLPLLAVLTAILWAAGGMAAPLILVLILEVVTLYVLRPRLHAVLDGAESAFDNLRLFTALLTRLEREPFQAPPLNALLARLASHHLAASRTLARLSTIVELAGSRHNLVLQLLEIPLLYSLQVARAAERWRAAHGQVVRAWIEVTGELEALASLARYGYEHPGDPFPELSEAPVFEGIELGHPLLPAASCVRNSVCLDESTQVLLVSGSNMSGKSTLLRTVGVNAVLALAGAAVRARSLKVGSLAVGASIRINDSLHEGSSRFYAEIVRLRQLYDRAGASALLFLLDELLQGTNSHDRRIGAQGIVRAFMARGAMGLISTHDLALTELTAADPRVRNVHFQDEIEDGRVKFDFKLRAGIVTHGNGVELMRAIGLDV